MDKVIPTDLDGKKIFYSGIENLVRVEENLHMHLAKPEVNLSHVLNIDGGLDLEPVNPVDAYFRRNNQLAPYPDDDRRIRDYEKVMSSWSKECSKVLAIVKSIYSQAILLELRTAIAPAILNNGSRANITAVMNSVRTRWGGYTPAKSTLSRNTFESTPKFTNCSSVTAILLSLRYEIAQRVMWSDLPNNVDHRFSETEKKSLLVSLMDSWDELKILHTRLRSPVVQAAMTYDQIVAELLDAILPLQEAELMSLQMSSDRSHATTSSSLVAYGRSGSVNRFEAPKLPSKCFNCGKNSDGHRSNDCPEPMCQWCHTVWPSVKAPGYHHNSVCPQKPERLGKSSPASASRQSTVCGNCKTPGHDSSKCIKPICGNCGTIWMSSANPAYHHFSKCPYPTVSQLGKRNNPFVDRQSRAHMTTLHDLLVQESTEQDSVEHGWSDDDDGDDSAPAWQRNRNL